MNTPTNHSEVARLRSQITAEYEAAEQALHGLASGTASHQFITARMERMGACVQHLATLVGQQEAARLLAEAIERGSGPPL
ncbi:MAG TPA: hypothetical protein VKR06_08595 [Ktedonosporobacter sp.]|nr:hypothetical protein [Ktedonosporobacter sp.]